MKEQDKKRIVWFCRDILLAAALIALDQWTKALAVAKLKGGEAFVILRNVFELEYLENRGSAFGMFQGKKVFLLIKIVELKKLLFKKYLKKFKIKYEPILLMMILFLSAASPIFQHEQHLMY